MFPMAVVKVKTKKGRKASFKVKSIDSDDVPMIEPLDDREVEVETLNLRRVGKDYEEEEEELEELGEGVYESDPLERKGLDREIPPKMHIHSVTDFNEAKPDLKSAEPVDVIKVKFSTFVQLLTNRDLVEAIEANANEELIMKSNLLTELASADNKREERKVPLVFLIGIAIGVVLSYIFFST